MLDLITCQKVKVLVVGPGLVSAVRAPEQSVERCDGGCQTGWDCIPPLCHPLEQQPLPPLKQNIYRNSRYSPSILGVNI